MKKQVKLTAKIENTCKKVYEQSSNFHQCGRFCQMQCCSNSAQSVLQDVLTGKPAISQICPQMPVLGYGKCPLLAVFIAAGACHAYEKNGLDLQSTANQPVFHFEPYFPHHSKKYSAYFILPSLYHSTVLTPFLPKSSLFIFPSMTFLPGLSLSPSETLPLTLYESK